MKTRNPRKPPDVYPYDDPTVPLVTNIRGAWQFACEVADKILLLETHLRENVNRTVIPPVFSFWPGKKRSDVFAINPKTALRKLKGTLPEDVEINTMPEQFQVPTSGQFPSVAPPTQFKGSTHDEPK